MSEENIPAGVAVAEADTVPVEETAAVKKPSFAEYVKMTLDSGVKPLELTFRRIEDPSSGSPIAYRTATTMHSVILGDLTEGVYVGVTDKRDTAPDVLRHSIRHVIRAAKEFEDAGRAVQFFSVRCPTEIIENENLLLFDIVREILEKNPSFNPAKLCLEFPASLFAADTERARTAVLDMKVLKVKTAVLGGGNEDFPLSRVTSVTPEYIILDPSCTAWAGSRDKPQLVSSLVSYVRSMGSEVIAEGESHARRDLRNADLSGFIPTDAPLLTKEEALAEKEVDE